jgi:hypothetical protein
MTFDCPRCRATTDAAYYGPCSSCRATLRARFAGQAHGVEAQQVEAPRYEPAMHVTPNAVALKD